MEGFHKVARTEDIQPGQAKVVSVQNRSIAVFNVADEFFALSNTCPHEGGPLGEGHVKGFIVTCPWHDLAFDLRDGHGTDGGGYCVGSYEVRVEGQDLFIGPRRNI